MHLWRIQQASSAYCSGVEIPVEMFSDWLTLRPYLAKVVQAQNEEERNSYDYAD
jgi:outer membrane biogenesis lipoprotein LolB